MASFMEDLWASVFTPGPTPTLLIATNVSFAALQLVLFVLLIATKSIHFVALSLLSAGLWYSINWFAKEVRIAQQIQEAEKKKQAGSEPGSEKQQEKGSKSVDGDSDTETESITALKASTSAVATGSAAPDTLQPVARESKKRPSFGGDSSGYASTDSDWEKVGDA